MEAGSDLNQACLAVEDLSNRTVYVMSAWGNHRGDLRVLTTTKAATSVALNLNTIILNVSGSGISPVLYQQWSSSNSGGSSNSPPSEFDFTVPKGTGRLVQVLEVFQDPTTQNNIFYYGDATADLSADTQSVTVSTNQSSTSAYESHVMGRYLDGSANGGPSGILNAYFQPPDGTQPMLVTTSEIFSGWFSIFVLDTNALTYTLNGAPVFNNVTVDSPLFSAAPSAVRVDVPVYDRINNGQTQTQGALKLVWDFLVTRRQPYRLPVTMFAQSIDPQCVCHGHHNATALGWNLIKHGDSNWINASVSGTTLSLNWFLLPGVADGDFGIKGLTVYASPTQALNNGTSDNGLPCSQIPTSYSAIDDVSTASGQVGVYSMSTTINNYPAADDLVICPYTYNSAGAKIYLDAGQRIYTNTTGGTPTNTGLSVRLAGFNFPLGPGLESGTYTLLKQQALSSGANFTFFAGDEPLLASDLSAVEVSTDGGTTWSALSVSLGVYSGQSIASVNGTMLSNLIASNSAQDSTLNFRVTATTTAVTNYGLINAQLVTPTLTLLAPPAALRREL
ncbi:unnamed protein product [Sphagnum balticum]